MLSNRANLAKVGLVMGKLQSSLITVRQEQILTKQQVMDLAERQEATEETANALLTELPIALKLTQQQESVQRAQFEAVDREERLRQNTANAMLTDDARLQQETEEYRTQGISQHLVLEIHLPLAEAIET